ncbi:MAG: hypothetical protein LIP03_11860 [Bacteroidales bacterium]|nr:hypothetical protein [Bacteroidales bacterium]
MRKTISFMAAIAMICLMAACGKKADTQQEAVVYSVEQVLEAGDSLSGQEVTVEGVCSHLCKHGGKKMFLKDTEDGRLLRVEAGELGSFPQETVGQTVKVTGELVEQRIDEDYLMGWERQQEEAEAKAAAEAANAAANGAEVAEADTTKEAKGHCDTDKQARQEVGDTPAERIAGYRERIAEQVANGGKPYLSFFHIVANSYEIVGEE